MEDDKAQQQRSPAGDKVLPFRRSSSDEDSGARLMAASSRKPLLVRHRRLAIVLCGVISFLVAVAVVSVILALTVYKIREPYMTIEAIHVHRRNGSYSASLFSSLVNDSTIEITASVKNPNSLAYYYGGSLTSIYYDGSLLTQSPGPSGRAAPHRTYSLNVTVAVSRFKMNATLLRKVLSADEAVVNASTRVDGHVKIFGFIKHGVDVQLNCTVQLAVANLTILGQNCWQSVWI